MRGHFDGAIMDIQLKFSKYLFVSMDSHGIDFLSSQWEFQDPKMEVLYHIFGHILWGYSLKFRPEK